MLLATKALKILIVEDEADFSDYLVKLIHDIDAKIEVTFVESRDGAERALSDQESFYDFITLDLNLPSSDGEYAKKPANGLAVLAECRTHCPGTPVLVLTASSTVQMIPQFLDSSHQIDVWAEGTIRPTIGHLPKENIDQLGGLIESIYSAITSLSSDVELICQKGLALPVKYDRLLRVFVRSMGGVSAHVKSIGGGLSDTKVYSVCVCDRAGQNIYNSVAKCGSLEDIKKDSENYEKWISRLLPEVTPRKLKLLNFGAKDMGGVFYGLASGYDSSFFEAALDGCLDKKTLGYVEKMTKLWVDTATVSHISIADMRRRLVDDDLAYEFIESYELEWAHEFENNMFYSKESIVHGDLHGENILVDVEGKKATLIDYGDVSIGSCALDPVTLECSFLFHPDGGLTGSDWPSLEQLKNWVDVEVYVKGSPAEDVIRFCREWSNTVKRGNRELAACLYSYALRQLKYPQTNKVWAVELLNAARNIYNST
jgi:CheY-like chemotaxis protein